MAQNATRPRSEPSRTRSCAEAVCTTDGVGLPVAVVVDVKTVTLAGEPSAGGVVSPGGGITTGPVGESVDRAVNDAKTLARCTLVASCAGRRYVKGVDDSG